MFVHSVITNAPQAKVIPIALEAREKFYAKTPRTLREEGCEFFIKKPLEFCQGGGRIRRGGWWADKA